MIGSDSFTEYLPANYEHQLYKDKRIKYKIDIIRGSFKRITKVNMIIMPEYDGLMPDLVLIYNTMQPEDSDDGTHFPGNHVPSQKVTEKTEIKISIPFEHLRDKCIGVFLQDEKDDPDLKIVPFGGDEQRIK